MGPIIVKLGGSVITDKSRESTIRKVQLGRLAKELKAARQPLVIVHGGGSFGHPLASRYKISGGYKNKRQIMGFCFTHRAMEKLNAEVIDSLHREGLPAIGIPPSTCTLVKKGKIEAMALSPLKKLLEIGIIPVLYGDAVMDIDLGMTILSGDQLVGYLARKLGAKRVIFGVDVDGVFTEDPKLNKKAKLVSEITLKNWSKISISMGPAKGADVTGGIKGKIEELLALARDGIQTELINASKPNILKRALLGERGLGTMVKA
jgi:isopentenyl phosphate kinase